MTVISEEAEIVREIFERFLAGATPYAIAAELDRRGVPTTQGKRWGQQPREAARSFRADRGPELAGDPVQVKRAMRVFPLPVTGLFLRDRTGRR